VRPGEPGYLLSNFINDIKRLLRDLGWP